ncbi:unnamed protein product [Rhizophagus irregularis]|nr:unnamed protein product [Rhizophagus irregularis]
MHAIKRYLRIGCDLSSGDDIAQAAKGLSGTSLANLEPNRNNDSESHEKNQKKNTPLHQPQPSISQYTTPETEWTMSIALESENDKNADEILSNEQPNDSNSFNSEEEIDISKSTMNKNYIMKICLYTLHYSFHLNNRLKVSISKRVSVKRLEDRMNARSMRDELLKHVEAGELEEEDIPKVNTI